MLQGDPTAIAAPVAAAPAVPAVPILIPTVIADAPAVAGSAGDQIAAVADDDGLAAAAAGAPLAAKTGLSPLAGKPSEKPGDKADQTDKTGDTTAGKPVEVKGPAPASTSQPAPTDTARPSNAPANPATEAAPAAADGDKKVDVAAPHTVADKAPRHATETADAARAADRPAAMAGDARLGTLHLVSAADGNAALQQLGAMAPGTAAAAGTGQAASPDGVGAAIPLAGIAVEIAARAQAGSNRFEIRLDPPELGRIDVRLDVDRHGNVTSRLIADRGDTLDLLRRDAPQLERALQDAGLKTGDSGLQFSLRDQGPGADTNARGNPLTNPPPADVPETDPLPAEALRSYRWTGTAGGVDIRV